MILVFDLAKLKEEFVSAFEKSAEYCESLTVRVVENTSLDFRIRENFPKIGVNKIRGTSYRDSFLATELLDWLESTESVDRERALYMSENLLKDGVIRGCDKKSHGAFLDKPYPYRFVWHDRESRSLIMKEVAKQSGTKFHISAVGHRGVHEIEDTEKLVVALRQASAMEDRMDKPFICEIDDLTLYKYWVNEKRLALDAVTPSARFHTADHIIWMSFDNTEYYIGTYGDLLELFSESHMFVGDACRIILKKEIKDLKEREKKK